jgi:glucokinase
MAKQVSHVLGFDLGGTKMMALVFAVRKGSEGKSAAGARLKKAGTARRRTKAEQGAKAVLARIGETVRDALADARVSSADLSAIGVASPGPLDWTTGVIIDSPNLGWKNVGLKAHLEKEFHAPTFVDNDVNLGTYGEYHFGAARGCRDVVGIFPGTGIGGGIIVGGRLVRGASGAAGEVGHVVLDPGGALCGCGRRGCVEAMASRSAIAQEAAAAALRGDAPWLLKNVGSDLDKIRSGELAKAIEAGDQVVEEIVRHAARLIGLLAANLVNVLSPEMIVLGGGLVEALEKVFVAEVRDGIERWALPFLAKDCRVAAAELGDDAAAMGAAIHALESCAAEVRD